MEKATGKRKAREEETKPQAKRESGNLKQEDPPERVKSKEAERSQDDESTVMVDFKFCSCETECVQEDEMSGVLQVPMLQDPQTGRFKIPPGETKAEGMLDRTAFSIFGGVFKTEKERFTATFTREAIDKPIDTFRLGYDVEYFQDEDIFCRVVPSTTERKDAENQRQEFQTYPQHYKAGKNEEYYRDLLNDWEKNAGGMLVVYAAASFDTKVILENLEGDVLEMFQNDHCSEADYKIKLYTVLSAHKQDLNAVPDWDALERVVAARFPEKGNDWAKRAVKQYIYFLELKKEHKDWDSKLFSPSVMLDEVWHAHLSFTDRYQHDMMAFCGIVIEHTPVLGEEAFNRYKAAYDAHEKQLKRNKESIDEEFWPEPGEADDEESHDGDSYDRLRMPSFSHCG